MKSVLIVFYSVPRFCSVMQPVETRRHAPGDMSIENIYNAVAAPGLGFGGEGWIEVKKGKKKGPKRGG